MSWQRRTFKQKRDVVREQSWAKQGIKNATIDVWEAILDEQGGKCAFCPYNVKGLKLCLDHDHVTGEIRGILCQRCNYYLGWFEKYNRLIKAFNYLRKARIEHPHAKKIGKPRASQVDPEVKRVQAAALKAVLSDEALESMRMKARTLAQMTQLPLETAMSRVRRALQRV